LPKAAEALRKILKMGQKRESRKEEARLAELEEEMGRMLVGRRMWSVDRSGDI